MNYAGTAAVLPIETVVTNAKAALLWSQNQTSEVVPLDPAHFELTGISNDGHKFIGNKYTNNGLTQGYIYNSGTGFQYLPLLNNGEYCEVKSIHQNGKRLLGFAENGLKKEFTLVQWNHNSEGEWEVSALNKGAITNQGEKVYIEDMFANDEMTYIALNLTDEYEGTCKKAALWTEATGFVNVQGNNLASTSNGTLPDDFFDDFAIVKITSAAPNGVLLGGVEEVWGDQEEYGDLPDFPFTIKNLIEKTFGQVECDWSSLTSANGLVLSSDNREIGRLLPHNLREVVDSIDFKYITPSGLKALGIKEENVAIITSLSYNLNEAVS